MKKKYIILFVIPFIFACNKENNDSDSCNVESLTDIDGNVYQVVSIGNQCWLKENYNVETFNNGDPIPLITSGGAWTATDDNYNPGYCYYDNDITNGDIYGKLYNGFAVNDPRGIAPDGWRVPTEQDYQELFNYLGGTDVAGGKMKNFSGGTNSSGFSALPGGHRIGWTGASNGGTFATQGSWANFWGLSWYFYINDGNDVFGGNAGPSGGKSLRLIKE